MPKIFRQIGGIIRCMKVITSGIDVQKDQFEAETIEMGLLVICIPVLSAGSDSVCHEVGELHSCCGIKAHPICNTPFGELVRIDVYTDDPHPFGLYVYAQLICSGEPTLISLREFISILKHGSESPISFLPIPGYAYYLKNFHECNGCCGLAKSLTHQGNERRTVKANGVECTKVAMMQGSGNGGIC